MEISLTAAGTISRMCPDGHWTAEGDGCAKHTAFYGGIQMIACKTEDGDYAGLWELRYMGYKLTALLDAAEAMSYGPEFAKNVLAKLQERLNEGSASVISSDPITDLDNLIDTCGAFPDMVSKMKVLVGMIRDETETLREGILSLNPEAQLAREAQLLSRIENLSQTIQKAL